MVKFNSISSSSQPTVLKTRRHLLHMPLCQYTLVQSRPFWLNHQIHYGPANIQVSTISKLFPFQALLPVFPYSHYLHYLIIHLDSGSSQRSQGQKIFNLSGLRSHQKMNREVRNIIRNTNLLVLNFQIQACNRSHQPYHPFLFLLPTVFGYS